MCVELVLSCLFVVGMLIFETFVFLNGNHMDTLTGDGDVAELASPFVGSRFVRSFDLFLTWVCLLSIQALPAC